MDIVGRWRKRSTSDCSARYPGLLELEPGGRYTGWNEEPSAFHPLWDRGGWEPTGADRMQISLANDARIEYTVECSGDEMVIVDGDGCRIEYVREGGET